MKLARNEYIQSVEVAIQRGMIATLNWIPQDWSIDFRWDTPDLALLNLQAGHFSSGLATASDLDGFITVQAGHPTVFEMKVTLWTEVAGREDAAGGSNVFTQAHLILTPVRRPQNLSRSHVLPAEFMKKYVHPPPFVSEAGEYVVRRGDTLASIARLYGLSISDLRDMNPGLQDEMLIIGQCVRVRQAEQE